MGATVTVNEATFIIDGTQKQQKEVADEVIGLQIGRTNIMTT